MIFTSTSDKSNKFLIFKINQPNPNIIPHGCQHIEYTMPDMLKNDCFVPKR